MGFNLRSLVLKLDTDKGATEWCSKSYIGQMSPTFPLLILFLTCLCFFSAEKKVKKHKKTSKHSTEQAKDRKTYKVKHKNRSWKIKTTNEEGEREHHGVQLGDDYQDFEG